MAHYPGYTVLRTEDCPEQHGTLTLLTHDVSGAAVLLVENEDVNKAFGIGFGTFPSDDTGVFHILEHSVLAGSEKYPVSSPFVQLLKSSMASFLNAMTFPDKTVYPFATPNETDFCNLMDVYLNAVFCPLAMVDSAVFEQEGWHRDADGTVSGVVYNEMQGALASPDAQLQNALERAMFPDTAYGFVSGGDPASIPALTYEKYQRVYRRHYSADNCCITLYGKMDMADKLARLDQDYLSKMPKAAARPHLTMQDEQPGAFVELPYYTDQPKPDEVQCALAWYTGAFADRERQLGVEVLLDALLGTNNSPLKAALLAVYAKFELFNGTVHQKAGLHLHLDGLLASLMTRTMPTQMIKTDRVTVEHSGAVDASGGGVHADKRLAHITLRQRAEEDRAYIESCFGRSLYPPERLRKAEQELCTGEHLGCHLWFASGVPSPEQAPTPEAKHLAEQAQLQAERNRAYYSKNLELHRSVVLRLTEQIRNCILVHQQPNARVARSGNLDPERVWRTVMDDDRVFRCAEEENHPSFTVDLLLDASASRLHCQEVIAAQGSILAQSLAACGIPVRVSCFSSLRGYTVLRVLKGFKEKSLQGICQYFASGWNRDGLALRAAGDLIDFDPGPAARHLLILLTDASPNDSRRIPPSPDDPLGRDYGGSAGVEDAAAEVRALQRKGLRVSAVFMGEDASAADASRIYGKNMARIRGMDQLARAAGRLIQNEIRELGD